jgi:hypothetical protein
MATASSSAHRVQDIAAISARDAAAKSKKYVIIAIAGSVAGLLIIAVAVILVGKRLMCASPGTEAPPRKSAVRLCLFQSSRSLLAACVQSLKSFHTHASSALGAAPEIFLPGTRLG